MRIAYICHGDLRAASGVSLKVNAQLAAWRAAGHDVSLYALGVWAAAAESATHQFAFASDLERFAATTRLTRAVCRYEPDLVYLRYDRFVPPLGRILRRFPTIVEINGDDREEARLKSRRASLYNGINRWAVLRCAHGIVCVTNELAASKRISSFSGPTVVIGNGVDLAAVPHLPAAHNVRPRLAFLGTRGESWQGVDKVAALAREMPGCDFDVVGYTERDLDDAPPTNLTVYGKLTRAEYERVLAKVDVGIGTLALHRKRMEEASPLKVREYLAHGIPVITAYNDSDFVGTSPWFMLRIPNTEDNVHSHRAEIGAFVQRVRGCRVSRAEVNEVIGAHAKERTRLTFMKQIDRGGSLSAAATPQIALPGDTAADPLG
jgi:glycosyltransferase involved in cell wall biosynthesis